MAAHRKYVSVFIPTFNGEKYIAESIESVLRQQLPQGYDLELLVIDSGSRDKTVSIIKAKYLDRLTFLEIPNAEFGHGKTRQFAVDHTKGEYVLFLTQDATPVDDHWLLNMIRPFALSPQVGCAFGRQIPRWDAVPTIKREVATVFAGLGPGKAISLTNDPNNSFFSDVNSAVSRRAIGQVPFRDLAYAEDQALAHDMIEAGFLKAYTPDGAVFHSNEYSVRGYAGRKLDEYLGLVRSIGYKASASRLKLLVGWIKPTIKDAAWTLRDREYGPRRKLAYLVVSVGYNVAARLGEYRAAKYQNDEDRISRLSQEAKQKR